MSAAKIKATIKANTAGEYTLTPGSGEYNLDVTVNSQGIITGWRAVNGKLEDNDGVNQFEEIVGELDESLSVNQAKSMDVDDFIYQFDQTYNTATEMWMSKDNKIDLKNKFQSGMFKFIVKDADLNRKPDASNTIKQKMKDTGWTLFDEEETDSDSYQAIFYKKK